MPVKHKQQKLIEAQQNRTHILMRMEAGKEIRRMFKAELSSLIEKFMDGIEGNFTGAASWADRFENADDVMSAFVNFIRNKG